MFTLFSVYTIVVLAMVIYHYRTIAKYSKVDSRLSNANKRIAAYRKANREYESAYNALLQDYTRVCWELTGYADNIERIANGEVKRIAAPVAIGDVSAIPLLPLFVDSELTPAFDNSGAIVFSHEEYTDDQRREIESAQLAAWNNGEYKAFVRPTKAQNGAKSESNGNGAKSENAKKSAESTPNNTKSDNVQTRDLASVIVEVGQAIQDTLSESERNKIQEWLTRESSKNAPATEYARWIGKMRNGKAKGK